MPPGRGTRPPERGARPARRGSTWLCSRRGPPCISAAATATKSPTPCLGTSAPTPCSWTPGAGPNSFTSMPSSRSGPAGRPRGSEDLVTERLPSRQDELAVRRARLEEGGGGDRVARQHAAGKLTARERLSELLDPGTFVELDRFVTHRATAFGMDKVEVPADGVVTGYGAIDARLVYVFSQDFTVLGGSLGEGHAAKICKLMDLALRNGAPVIGLNDSGGARIQEGVVSLGAYAEIFLRNTLASGVVPQISAILGPCAGGAVYSPAITDFTLMVEGTSYMFVTGPNVVKTVTHEEIDFDGLGGARVHNERSGVAQFMAAGEPQAISLARRLLGYLPQNNVELTPLDAEWRAPEVGGTELDALIPDSPQRSYDMHTVVRGLVDA